MLFLIYQSAGVERWPDAHFFGRRSGRTKLFKQSSNAPGLVYGRATQQPTFRQPPWFAVMVLLIALFASQIA